MRITVPQFIEHEAKIVGPLTFKQFIFIGVSAAVCFIFYALFGKTSFLLFLILSIISVGIGASLAFLKIGGRGLPIILVNFFRFSIAPKLYIWKREKAIVTFSKKIEMKKELKEGEPPLKTVGTSQLKKIKTEIETKTK